VLILAQATDAGSSTSGWGHFVRWVGHFHPAMTVFPIGLLLAGVLAEILRIATKAAWLEGVARYCVIVAAVGGAITAPLGWAFAVGHGHSWVLETHRWIGTFGASWLLALLVISEVSRRKGGGWHIAYLAGLFLAVPGVAATGFLGGAMVYGLHEYDWQPRNAAHGEPSPQSTAAPTATPPPIPSSQTASISAVIVTMTDDMTFVPATLTIPLGTTVRWENHSKDTHTVTADPKHASDARDVLLPDGAEPFDSGKIKPGDTYSHTFVVPGTYKYTCIPHEEMGMLGQIDVKPAQ
jgi:plastocyanin